MHCRRTIWSGVAALLLAALSMGVPLVAQGAGSFDGEFEIRSAYIVFDHGVGQLNAHVQYPLGEQVRTALADGVTLDFNLDVTISRPRRLWFNATLIDLHLQRELSYHAVSDRYVLRDTDGTGQQSFPTVEAAVETLSRVENLPIVVESQLHGDGPWEVSVRAAIRRGRMPGALRALVFWSDDWYRSSEWYTWSLSR